MQNTNSVDNIRTYIPPHFIIEFCIFVLLVNVFHDRFVLLEPNDGFSAYSKRWFQFERIIETFNASGKSEFGWGSSALHFNRFLNQIVKMKRKGHFLHFQFHFSSLRSSSIQIHCKLYPLNRSICSNQLD